MDWKYSLYGFVLLFFVTACSGGRTLTEILSHYDTLNKVDFHHRERRSVSENADRTIDFVSHGKTFHMKLDRSKEIFTNLFSVVTVDRYGKETPLKIDMDSFYEGYVKEDASSFVTAQVEDDGMITASIDTANETYIVEPMWRHTDNPSHDMIVYKASNLKWNISSTQDSKAYEPHVSVCGTTDLQEEVDQDRHNRSRRSAKSCARVGDTEKNTCDLHLVADYLFFREVGRRDAKTATHYMLNAIKRVDGIYRETCWDHIWKKGIGVQVQKITVHTEFSDSEESYNIYNPGEPNHHSMLTAFSKANHKDFCLAHLFTYQDFPMGVIGRAYVGSKGTSFGGICSPKSDGIYLNCGFTTHINWGRKLTTLESTLVTVHEIGHNFGSNHDPLRCSSTIDDGRYVMYATSVSGAKANNRQFSECSRSEIGAVLQRRMHRCLKPKSTRCGNGVVEESEECDEGVNPSNPCCRHCKLINGANCSDSNHICCDKCQLAKKDQKVCKEAFTLVCKGKIMCDGLSKSCPEDAPKLDSGVCIIESNFKRGYCAKGQCESLCSVYGLTPCSCSAGNSSCRVCCKADAYAECKPIPSNEKEHDGVECEASKDEPGLCDTGKCQKLKLNVKETFGNLLTDFSIDKAVRFMRNNIVLTILFFSLLIWVPAGFIVSRIDQKMENERIAHDNMKNQLLIKSKGSFKKNKNKDDHIRVRSGKHLGT